MAEIRKREKERQGGRETEREVGEQEKGREEVVAGKEAGVILIIII